MDGRGVNGPHCRLVKKKSRTKRAVGKYAAAAFSSRREQLKARDADAGYRRLIFDVFFQLIIEHFHLLIDNQ